MSDFVVDEESIFAHAIEIENESERAGYLDRVCAGNAVLRSSVDELLSMHDTAGEFLETPAIGVPIISSEEQSDDVIDRYRLVKRIGEGGFGVVWEARQEHPVERSVALKIMRPDIGTQRVIARFESERQTLAMMNHPNIATVLDAGATASGRSYFVMELVDGRSIDEYCLQHQVIVRRRIKMMVRVCQAVHHAHQKGIVHRDLKPSNILVTSVNGKPSVKVIDFGISKAVREGLGGDADRSVGDETIPGCVNSMLSVDRQVLGTPQFMSPEQFAGDPDIDTRADVYALGGVLYKLLTGEAPYAIPANQSALSIRGLVCDGPQPLSPSQRITASNSATNPLGIAGASKRQLEKQIRGDLDAIVIKALRKERNERYQSVDELANDLQRYLSHEPVVARESGGLYRAQKFARRHRTVSIAGGVAIVALITGSIAATVGMLKAQRAQQLASEQFMRAERERDNADRLRQTAQQEASNARKVASLLEEMLGASDPQRGMPADWTVRDQIDAFAKKLDRDRSLADLPEVRANLLRTIGRSYLNLRYLEQAEPRLRAALEIRRRLYADHDRLVLESRVDLAQFLLFANQRTELRNELDDLLPRLRDLGPSDLLVQTLIIAGSNQASGARNKSAFAKQAWESARDYHGEEHWITLTQQGRVALQSVSRRSTTAELQECLQSAREALAALESKWPDEELEIAMVKSQVAKILILDDRLDEAEACLRQSIESYRDLLGETCIYAIRASVDLTRAVSHQGRADEAMAIARDVAQIIETTPVSQLFLDAGDYRVLAKILRTSSPLESANMLKLAIDAERRFTGNTPLVAQRIRNRGTLLWQTKQWKEAEACLLEALEIQQSLGNHPAVARLKSDLLQLREEAGGAKGGQPRGENESISSLPR